jgi:hypothetical protein
MKEANISKMPLVQNRIKASRNGRYIISQTIITSIKPIEYYNAVLANVCKITDEPLGEDELLTKDW